MLLYTMKVSMKPLMPSRWRRLVIMVLPKVLLQSEDGSGAPCAEELGEGDADIDVDAVCRRPEKS